jgi:succinoglycan biosynthesis transport protein ExoP
MERETDEISLREILEVVWNGKWIIVLVTSIAIIISGIVSFFILNPAYEARTTLIVSSEKLEDHPSPPSVQTYVEQVKNHSIMSRTIDQLGLRQQDISVNDLREKIDVTNVKDTNLIRIIVSDKDPKLASDMANAVTHYFVDFMTNQAMEQLINSSEHVIDQIDLELKVNKGALTKVNEEIAKTPEILVTNKSLSEDAFLYSVVAGNQSQSKTEVGGLQMRSEETNPVYISLQQAASNLNVEISRLENKRNELDEKIKENGLKVQENITIVSKATEPEKPVGPNKRLNVTISGAVGGMVSLFIVFILHYWRTTATKSSTYRKIENGSVDKSM